MRVVIVEDESRARRLMVRLLKLVDDTIILAGEAANAQEGIELISAMYPDVAFVDIKMPGMSGIEMIERLQGKNLKTQYYIISGCDEFSYAQKAIELGIKGYILKPVSFENISEVVQKAYRSLEGRSLSKENMAKIREMEIRKIVDRDSIESPLVKSAIAYVCDNISIPCSLNDTAVRLNVSPDYLSRLFHKEVQMTFMQFVRMVKIDYTCVLLKKTDMKVYEIALAAGFRQDKYYCHVFKELMGVTPNQYRKQSKGEGYE